MTAEKKILIIIIIIINRPQPAGRRTRSKYFKNNYNHIPKLRVRDIPHVPPRPVRRSLRRRSNAQRDDAAAAHRIIIEIHFHTRDTLVHATDLRVSLPAGPTDCACAFYSQTDRDRARTSGRTLTNAPKCAAAQWRSRARCPFETLILLPSLKSRNERRRRLVVRITATAAAAAAAAARPTRHDGRQRGQFGTGRCVVSPDRKSRRIY